MLSGRDLSIETGIGEYEMHLLNSRKRHPLAVLFLLAGFSSFAAAETGTASDLAAAAIQPATTVAGSEGAAQRDTCIFRFCDEANLDAPQVETVVGSDVMPAFNSPALNPTVEAKAGC